jgi:hypothetical protein
MIELLVVIAAIGILTALMMASASRSRERSNRIKCVGNLKQVSLSLKIFASDHQDRYPYQHRPPLSVDTPDASLALTNATRGNIDLGAAWAHWLVMSNEMGSPKLLMCSGNQAKRSSIASDWSSKSSWGYLDPAGWRQMKRVSHNQDRIDYERKVGYDLSNSYWLSLNADETIPAGVLIGDANLNWSAPNGDSNRVNPTPAGVQSLDQPTDFAQVRFVNGRSDPKYYRHHQDGGNIALTDGSVVQLRNAEVSKFFTGTTNAMGKSALWLVIPR